MSKANYRLHTRTNTRTKSSYLLTATGKSKNHARLEEPRGARRGSPRGFLRCDFKGMMADGLTVSKLREMARGAFPARHCPAASGQCPKMLHVAKILQILPDVAKICQKVRNYAKTRHGSKGRKVVKLTCGKGDKTTAIASAVSVQTNNLPPFRPFRGSISHLKVLTRCGVGSKGGVLLVAIEKHYSYE